MGDELKAVERSMRLFGNILSRMVRYFFKMFSIVSSMISHRSGLLLISLYQTSKISGVCISHRMLGSLPSTVYMQLLVVVQ